VSIPAVQQTWQKGERLQRPKLPCSGETSATRIFHFIRIASATWILHLILRAIEQAFASQIFHFNDHAIQESTAPAVIDLNRRNLAPRVIHSRLHSLGKLMQPIAAQANCDQFDTARFSQSAQKSTRRSEMMRIDSISPVHNAASNSLHTA
jgi:hypothetical protein